MLGVSSTLTKGDKIYPERKPGRKRETVAKSRSVENFLVISKKPCSATVSVIGADTFADSDANDSRIEIEREAILLAMPSAFSP